MVQVASPIEDHLFDPGRQGPLTDHLANRRRTGAIGSPGVQLALGGAGRSQGAAGAVIDHLGVDMPQAAVDAKPRPGLRPHYPRADSPVAVLARSNSLYWRHA